MEIELSEDAEEHLLYFKKSGQVDILKKIKLLFDSMQENPIEGIGKPEALKHNLSGFWSRRINREHRILYKVIDDSIWIYSLKGHYDS
jgi:toxin YoeB